MASGGAGIGGVVGAIAGVAALALSPWSGGASLGLYLSVASAGFAVGGAIGGIIDPAKGPNSQGARLSNLSITASTYGIVIPYVAGDNRLAGNVIWGLPIKETATTTSSGGKGGSKQPQSSNTEYSYSITMALGLCRGVATGIVRIWANGSLIYDMTANPAEPPTVDPTDPLAVAVEQSTANVNPPKGLNFTFYPGDEDQLPDPLWEAALGVGNVSANRGLCYIVLEDMDLTPYGNIIPNIQVQVAFGATADTTEQIITAPVVFSTYSSVAVTVNPLTLRGYIWGNSPTGIAVFDLQTMLIKGEHSLGDIMNDATYNSTPLDTGHEIWIGYDQFLYVLNAGEVLRINPLTFTGGQKISLGNDDNIGSPFAPNSYNLAAAMGAMGPQGLEPYFMVAGGNTSHIRFFTAPEAVAFTKLSPSGTPVGLCPGRIDTMFGQGYCLSNSGTTIFVDTITVSIEVSAGLLGPTFSRTVNIATDFNIDIASIDTTPGVDGIHSLGNLVYDFSDDSVMLQVISSISGTVNNAYFLKWSRSGGVIWITLLPVTHDAASGIGAVSSDIRNGRFGYIYGQNILVINTADGVVRQLAWPQIQDGQQLFSSIANCIVAHTQEATWVKIPLDRLTTPNPTLESIFTDVCTQAGMVSDDFNASELSGLTITGFAVSQRTHAADILTPLMQYFQIDAVETDGTLKFQPRGGSIAATITEADMIRPGSSASSTSPAPEAYTETRAQESTLPARLTVSYVDPAGDYQVNTQMARRIRAPDPTVFSDDQTDIQLGVVMDSTTALQQAEKLLYATWLERHSFSFSLPQQFVYLDVADPVMLELNSGFQMRGRITKADLGADNSLAVTVVAETDGQYVSTAVGIDPPGTFIGFIAAGLPTRMFLLDVPLLRDTDAIAGTGSRVYWAAAPYVEGSWPGAQLQGSPDLSSWQGLSIDGVPCAWGALETALPDAISSFRIHYDESIVVQMVSGGATLDSITDLQLCNGFNGAAVFKANGDIEIIQFQTVTALGGVRYQLSGLNRGARGTDTMAGGHAAGEIIVMLHTATTKPFILPLTAVNVTGYYRAVTSGSQPVDAVIDAQVFHGRDMKPYAPTSLAAALSGSDIIITWLHRSRTRLASPLVTDSIPIDEATESYSIDIYDAPGTTVLRTLTATSETVTYTAANISTDFGSTPTSLNVEVFQISATVGRGFGRLDSIGVS